MLLRHKNQKKKYCEYISYVYLNNFSTEFIFYSRIYVENEFKSTKYSYYGTIESVQVKMSHYFILIHSNLPHILRVCDADI